MRERRTAHEPSAPYVICVTGGRSYTDRAKLDQVLTDIAVDVAESNDHFVHVELMHGCASGADRLADDWARKRGTPVYRFPADWAEHGKAAGPMRNQQMVDAKPDEVVAFPGGAGTADMVRRAKAAGIRVTEVV